ncbi:MAG TPA: VanW family protein [Clostridiaceae bacterium]
MLYLEKKPIIRSKLRLYIGKKLYSLKRHGQWYLPGRSYAKEINNNTYDFSVFSHRTPLLRKLKDVDMYLQYNKITNLKLAIKMLNNIVLKPGETLSYWKLIGKPTYKKGYLEGLVLCPDGSFKSGIGGGLCQLSNLIYWMTLHTPLIVTERHRHSHDVFPDEDRKQPFGTGATCAYNSLDLQIYNGTDSEYQLVLYLSEDHLNGEWRSNKDAIYSYLIYEKEHYITAGCFGGYVRNNSIYRKVFQEGFGELKEEFITENHAYMLYSPILAAGIE